MFPIRVALVSRSSQVDFTTLSHAANAINLQVTRDFGPIWNINATVVALSSDKGIPPGLWPVFIVDDVGQDGTLGFHLTEHQQPYAMVQAGGTWTVNASHEVLEMLADPSGNRLISSTSVEIVNNEVRDGDHKFEYLVEVCDPSEDPSNAYLIDDVLVSDFYTPHYFDHAGAVATRYSYSGKITRPRQVLPNGYLSWINPLTRTLQQARAFGAPDIADRGRISLGAPGQPRSSIRGLADSLTKSPVNLSQINRAAPAVTKRAARKSFLEEAAALQAAAFDAATPIQAVMAAAQAPGRKAAKPKQPHKPSLTSKRVAPLSKPGVLSVRAGHLLKDGWVSQEPAYVVTVRPEAKEALAKELPTSIDSFPVDIRAASPIELLAADKPHDYAVMADARHELRMPEFADEIRFDGQGKPLTEDEMPAALLAARRPPKPHLNYTPANVPLDAITDDFELILHASPERGWAELQTFLDGAAPRLVAGMYDFTSKHILDAVESALGKGSMVLTLDHPAKNPSADQSDEDTIKALEDSLKNFESAWALTNSDPKASQWIYPNAYHIKVAIRDDGAFWLSSGNWNNSNQPVIDLSDIAAAQRIAKNHDRDWHVIVKNPQLAETFREYLLNDHAIASEYQSGKKQALAFAAELPVPAALEVPLDVFAAGRNFRQFFPSKKVTGRFEIQPLLTPDNYADHVLPLIESAKERFYMQTQYIHPGSGDKDAKHNELIDAVQTLITNGVDVRLICSEFMNADWLEKLSNSLDIGVLRVQPKVHNKGIVVDSVTVMVSSQNWSADGTLRNRDAGLIIRNPEAAQYFEEIFLHDWNYLAAQRTAN